MFNYKSQITIVALALLTLMTSCASKPVMHPTDEPFRSVYHHTPDSMWMNDPNGMYYDETTQLWHLYYQHNPFGTTWGPMHWAHSVSSDLIHWTHLPIAIYPDSLGTIFSGSAVIDRNNTAGFGENAVVAIYTQAEKIGQNQSIAYSTDGGKTYTKYDGNPVLKGDIADFRDPNVYWDTVSGKWIMTLACQQEIRFYSSADLKTWQYESSFGHGIGAHGGVWECPELLQLPVLNDQSSIINHKYVLLVSLNPGGPFGGSATQYFIGDWDGKTFTPFPSGEGREEAVPWLDYGKDNYSTFTFHNCPDGRVVSLGWMSNWQYANQVPTIAFRSQNTIARDLSLYIDDAGAYRVRVMPSAESMAIRGSRTTKLPDAAIVELSLSGTENSLITLSNDKGEKVQMTLDVAARTFSMDRTASGDCSFSGDFAAVTKAPLFNKHDEYHLTLFIDHCSIEAFGDQGEWAMTNLVFPSQPYNKIDVVGGKATIYNCNL